MYFKCQFPNCDYEAQDLGSFDNHHIKPKSMGGSDKGFNRLLVCPNCHRKIFVENMEYGVHSVKRPGSIVILTKLQSTAGNVLHYKKCDDNEEYYWWDRLSEETSAK
jgi:hypothetical protein